jgi:hypothetical protein
MVRRRATSIICGAKSMAVTCAPRRPNRRAIKPLPVAMSNTRMPGCTGSIRSIAGHCSTVTKSLPSPMYSSQ